MRYKDFKLSVGDKGCSDVVSDTDALIKAIKNILLSKPGNFPLTPGMGVNIGKYAFDILDETLTENIKAEISEQINKYIPDVRNVEVKVEIVENPNNGAEMLGVSIKSALLGDDSKLNFLIYKENEMVGIVDEFVPMYREDIRRTIENRRKNK